MKLIIFASVVVLAITGCTSTTQAIKVDTLFKVKPISLIFDYLAATGIA